MNDLSKPLKTPSVAERLTSLIMEMSEEQQETLLKELEERLPKEKRQHLRKPFPTFVDFVAEGRSYREFTRDISDGGVFIETSTPFSVGKQVVMTFAFPDSSNHLKVGGRIARVEDAGVGIQFNTDSLLETLTIRSLSKRT
jgi:hypothetical protein